MIWWFQIIFFRPHRTVQKQTLITVIYFCLESFDALQNFGNFQVWTVSKQLGKWSNNAEKQKPTFWAAIFGPTLQISKLSFPSFSWLFDTFLSRILLFINFPKLNQLLFFLFMSHVCLLFSSMKDDSLCFPVYFSGRVDLSLILVLTYYLFDLLFLFLVCKQYSFDQKWQHH